MTLSKIIRSLLLSCLLLATLLTGCKEKQISTTSHSPDANNAQSLPTEESATLQPPQKHVASTPARAIISRQPPLDISALLRPADVTKKLGHKQLKVEAFPGQPATSEYNSLRIVHTKTAATTFGIGLQVWKFDDLEAAKSRLTELQQQYLGVQPLPAELKNVADDAFVSERGRIRNCLFVAPPSIIVGISCEKTTCTKWSDLAELATDIQSRI